MSSLKVVATVALLGAAVVLAVLVAGPNANSMTMGTELVGTWTKQHGIGIDKEPYSAPMNLWMYWGPMTNKRFTDSGEHVTCLRWATLRAVSARPKVPPLARGWSV